MYNDLRELYNDIKNPLDNYSNIKNYVYDYSDSSFNYQTVLVRNRNNETFHEDIAKKNRDAYYVYLFNIWKFYLTSISRERFEYLKKNRYLHDDFLILQKYLKKIPNANSKADVDRYLFPNNANLRILIIRYGFSQEKVNDWNNIYSEDVTGDQLIHYPIQHFLTVNTKRYDTLKFCKIFHKKCIEHGIPYYYKFNDNRDLATKVIIYSDSDHLVDYTNILLEIQKEYPKLISRCGKPSILNGNINEFIGYGSQSNDLTKDYYRIRSAHLKDSIKTVLDTFIRNNLYTMIYSNNDQMSIIDYISASISLDFIKSLSKGSGFTYVKHFNSRDFYNAIFLKVKNSIIMQISNSKTGLQVKDISFSYYTEGMSFVYTIKKEFIEKSIRKNAYQIFEYFPSLYETLKSHISLTSFANGISSNYCIDRNAFVNTQSYASKNGDSYCKRKN